MKRKLRHRPARSVCTYCGRPFFHRADSRPQFCDTGCGRLAYLSGERGDGETPLRGGQLPRDAAPDPFTRRLADGFALLQGEEN